MTARPCGHPIAPNIRCKVLITPPRRDCGRHSPPAAPTAGQVATASAQAAMIDPMHTPTPSPGRTVPSYRFDTAARRIDHFTMLARDGDLLLDPPYQRGSVWTVEQRVNLIRSFQIGLPIPAITVSDRGVDEALAGRPQFAVVDGRQRIETILAWSDDRLAVPVGFFDADDIEPGAVAPDGTITRSGLTTPGDRNARQSWVIPQQEATGLDVAAEADLYLLLNFGGVAQTEDDRARAAGVAGR